jgi:gamma-carbonic anhydrase
VTRGAVFALGTLVPVIDPSVWLAPTALVVGDVTIGAGSSVWFGAVLRGDINAIRVGARSNVQDNAVLHVASDLPCLIGDDVLIGHAAVVHACELQDHAFIGMGAVVLNGAVVQTGGVLAAGALLTGGKIVGPNELWAGSPARFVRVMPAAERAVFDDMTARYVCNAARFRGEMRSIE